MKRICLLFSIGFSFVFSSILLSNELQKVFHHRCIVHDSEKNKIPSIELGMIVFYFSQEALIKELPAKNHLNQTNITFFFPLVNIPSAEVRQMITQLQNVKNPLYSIRIQETKNPNGLEVIIGYNSDKVIFNYELFDAITLHKGVVFHFYNKALLDTMKNKLNNGSILRTAHINKRPIIIIDAGHGGKDSGTIGFFGLKEKDITLAVADKVKKLCIQKGFEVLLTREADNFVALDERTLMANNCNKPCIFISLHANHASKKEVSGIETFCLKKDLFKKPESVLQTSIDIFIDQAKDDFCKKSQLLATQLHENILKQTRALYPAGNDRCVKYAVSQVMMGVLQPGQHTVPSVLLEMEYLSNETTAKLLSTEKYQMAIAQGIVSGIQNYLG